MPDPAVLAFVSCSLLTHIHQLEALLWRAPELVGRELRTFAGFLSCLTPFVYLARLHRRIMEKGAPLDGPLASGTGTVE